ncbi:hypothetical protein D3C75_1063250 [compost metagenome]
MVCILITISDYEFLVFLENRLENFIFPEGVDAGRFVVFKHYDWARFCDGVF